MKMINQMKSVECRVLVPCQKTPLQRYDVCSITKDKTGPDERYSISEPVYYSLARVKRPRPSNTAAYGCARV